MSQLVIKIPPGLQKRIDEVCTKYDKTQETLFKEAVRNALWYERTYHKLPGGKAVDETGEIEEKEIPTKSLTQRIRELFVP